MCPVHASRPPVPPQATFDYTLITPNDPGLVVLANTAALDTRALPDMRCGAGAAGWWAGGG